MEGGDRGYDRAELKNSKRMSTNSPGGTIHV